MIDTKEQLANLKAERRTKDPSMDSGLMPRWKRKGVSKPFKVMCIRINDKKSVCIARFNKPWVFGRYETLAKAQQAIGQKMTDAFYRDTFRYEIVEEEK